MTSRMRWFCVSATTISPLKGITATPDGLLKLAAVPVPSAYPPPLFPVSVVTTPEVGFTSRMRLLPSSATTIRPLEGITASPAKLLKLAAVPVPSAKELLPLPASVVTAPEEGFTSRTR